MQTTYVHLVPKLRINGVITDFPPSPLWDAEGPVYADKSVSMFKNYETVCKPNGSHRQ